MRGVVRARTVHQYQAPGPGEAESLRAEPARNSQASL